MKKLVNFLMYNIDEKIKKIFYKIIEIIEKDNTLKTKQKGIIANYLDDKIKKIIKNNETNYEGIYMRKTYNRKMLYYLVDSAIAFAEKTFDKDTVLQHLLELALSTAISISVLTSSYEMYLKSLELVNLITRIYSFIKGEENVIEDTINEYREMMLYPVRQLSKEYRREFLLWYDEDENFRNAVKDFVYAPDSEKYQVLLQLMKEKIEEKIELILELEKAYNPNSNIR